MPNQLRKPTVACQPAAPSGAAAIAARENDAGTLHLRNLTLPPSDLWSAEFRKFYVESTANERAMRDEWPAPAQTAPKAEWDKFDAWIEERLTAGLLAAVARRYPVDMLDTTVAGVHVGIVSPRDGVSRENERRILINLRGGGFVINRGLAAGYAESAPVASLGRIKVVTIDYRQAPFHRYPAASEDVEAVYKALLQDYSPAAIGIFGCSAGSVLAAQTLARLQSQRLPCPGAIGIFSMAPAPPFGSIAPWESGWGDSGIWHAGIPKNVPSATDEAMYETVRWYMEGCDVNDACAYPGACDAVLAQFPPTLLLSGTRDFAASTIIATHARLLKLGVRSSLYLMEGAPHAAHVTAVDTPEARDANAHVALWFMRQLTA